MSVINSQTIINAALEEEKKSVKSRQPFDKPIEPQHTQQNLNMNFYPIFFKQFLEKIQQEFTVNKALYSRYLHVSMIQQMLQQFSNRYRTHAQAIQFIELISDCLSYCKNKSGCSPALQTKLTQNYHQQIAQRWRKIRQSSYFNNKRHLKILSYIVSNPLIGVCEYGHNFQSLKFDLSLEETRDVAKAVKKMMRQDVRSWCYLTNYLYNSCVRLDKAGHSIKQIQFRYNDVLHCLMSENPPAPPIQESSSEQSMHQNWEYRQLIPKIQLNLECFKSSTDKQIALESFILNRAEQARQQLSRFNTIIKKICQQNEGIYFQSGVKIKNRNEYLAMTRIKEKMLGCIYQQKQLQENYFPRLRNQDEKDLVDLYSYYAQDVVQHKTKIKYFFDKLSLPIPYKVSDMLRGRCVFFSIRRINQCCQQIMKFVKERSYENLQIIGVANNLATTSRITIKILFGQTIAEVELVKNIAISEYNFSHGLYQLKRSKFFTPLTQLFHMNQHYSKDYLTEVREIILKNKDCIDDYNQRVTFRQCWEHFKKFYYKLELRINLLEAHRNIIDIRQMKQQIARLKTIVQAELKEEEHDQDLLKIAGKAGVYYFEMKEHSKAAMQFSSALQMFQTDKNYILDKINNGNVLNQNEVKDSIFYLKNLGYAASNYKQMGKYQQALQSYHLQIKLITKLNSKKEFKMVKEKQKQQKLQQSGNSKTSFDISSILLNVGTIHAERGDYNSAIKYYSECLNIHQNAKDKSNTTYPRLLLNIGSVYQAMGKYQIALQYFKNCLQIQQKMYGKMSLITAQTIQCIGNVLKNMGKYDLSISHYIQCLQIQQQYLGKGSIDSASTLNNLGTVYNNLHQYELAQKYYTTSLQIFERIKGKRSIDTASTLNNIGNVYFEKGNYHQALKYYKQCLEIKQGIKGQYSIDVASTLNNIGMIYGAMGSYAQALKYYQTSLNIIQKIKGKKCIDSAQAINNIGLVYSKMGQYDKALKHYHICVQIEQEILGKGNIKTATTILNIGNVYYNMGKYDKALQKFKWCLEMQQRKGGKGNANAAITIHNIGLVYKSLGEYNLALEYLRYSLEIQQKTFGKENLHAIQTLENIGNIYMIKEQFKNAISVFKHAISIFEKLEIKSEEYTNFARKLKHAQLKNRIALRSSKNG